MAAAVAPRDYTITYGSAIVGSGDPGDDTMITGFSRSERNWEGMTFEFEVLNHNAAGVGEIEGFEELFRTPDQALTVAIGGVTRYTFNPSAQTALNVRPRIVKEGQEGDSARTVIYRITIDVGLPANLDSRVGRRESRVDVAFGPNQIKEVTFSGVWTAVPGTDARAQFDAQIAGFESTELTAIGGTFQLVEQRQGDSDDNDKELTFERVYREIKFNEASGTLNSPNMVLEALNVKRNDPAPGDAFGPDKVQRLQEIEVSYEAVLDAQNDTDLKGFWTSTARPRILQYLRTLAGRSTIAVIAEAPEFQGVANRIVATMSVRVAFRNRLVEASVSWEADNAFGNLLLPILDGNSLSKALLKIPRSMVRTITERLVLPKEAAVELSASPNKLESLRFNLIDASVKDGQWIPISEKPKVTRDVLGRKERFTLTEITLTRVEEFAVIREPAESVTFSDPAGASGNIFTQ